MKEKKSPAYSSDDTIAYVSISTGEAAHQSMSRDVLINVKAFECGKRHLPKYIQPIEVFSNFFLIHCLFANLITIVR